MVLVSILIAAAAMWLIGAAWYSPALFAQAWAREAGINPEQKPDGKTMMRMFGGSYLLMVLGAAVLDCILTNWTPGQSFSHGLGVGFLCGVLGGVFTGINYIYEYRGLKLFFINAGYYLVGFCTMGLVLSAF